MADKEMKVVFERPPCAPARRHQLLPWVRPRHRQPPRGRVPRRAGRGRLHRGHRPRRLHRHVLRLLRLRHDRGRARPRPGGGHRGEARAARRRGVRLPGRRRPGVHRHGRDGPRGHARREHHRHLREQRHLRHDGRPDGPQSLPNQVTQTSPLGRNTETAGFPIRVCELLSSLDGVAYLERVTVDCPKNVRKAKKAIRRAFQTQIDGRGYSLVEIVGTCPTNWGMTPQDAFAWMNENMLPYYPLGVYKDVVAEGYADAAEAASARNAACPIAHPDSQVEGGAR